MFPEQLWCWTIEQSCSSVQAVSTIELKEKLPRRAATAQGAGNLGSLRACNSLRAGKGLREELGAGVSRDRRPEESE